MENKTPTPTALKRAVQPSTTPSALNKVAKPETTKPLLEKHERTGAKVMVHRAGTTVSVPQAVKPDVPSSAGNRAEKPGAQTAKSFEVVKGAVDARSKREDKKPYVKPTSPRKVAANRGNAQLSTGPKTKEGKSHSRWNSHKHGILANALLVTDGPAAENVAEFDRLLAGHRQGWEPKGDREESLVETITICDWRMARSLRAEAGLISRNFVIDRAGPTPDIQALGTFLGRDEKDEREQEIKSITDHLSLPLNRRLDLILRYQATIQRIQASAIIQLERLQLRRKGEQVPPPLKVQLSTD
jgi:hypothetical protein